MTARALASAVLAAALLTGCATDARSELRALVEQVTVEANDRDADGLRRAVDELLERLDRAVAAGDIGEAEAAAIRDRAAALRAGADEIDEDVLARREAERRAQEAEAARQEAERAAAEAEQRRLEEERRRAEEEAERAAEEAKKAEQEAKKEQEEAEKQREEAEEESAGDADRTRGKGSR